MADGIPRHLSEGMLNWCFPVASICHQATNSLAPQKLSHLVSERKLISLPLPDNNKGSKTHDASHKSKTATGPETVQSVPSDLAAQTFKSTVASDGSSLSGGVPADSGALFFIDAKKDLDKKPTNSLIPVSTLESLFNKETDDKEECIVF